MRFIYLILEFGLAIGFGGTALLADPGAGDEVAARIARLPWDAVVTIGVPAAESQVTVSATYAKPGVVQDTEVTPIRVAHAQTVIGKDGRLEITGSTTTMRSKNRDGIGVWCNGTGRVEKADKDGFDYRLKLTWQKDKEGLVHFDEVFHCAWVKEQKFSRDGMELKVSVEVK